MTVSEELFLMLSDELNFTKTAEKAFISQQCLSTHIKRLEEKFGKRLLIRKPKVMLTPAGELVREMLLSVKQIELGTNERLFELENGQLGVIRIGINSTRASIIMPRLFSVYHRLFPDVRLKVITDETMNLSEALKNGELDCVLGINNSYSKQLISDRLSAESLSLVVSDAFLNSRPLLKHEVECSEKVNIRLFNECSMITDSDISTTYQLISQLAANENTHFKRVLSIESYDVSEEICRHEDMGFFCPDIALGRILKNNSLYPDGERLRAIPVMGLSNIISFSIITFKDRQFPKYTLEFFKHLHRVVNDLLKT